jgi:putative intracellular protease/amidase
MLIEHGAFYSNAEKWAPYALQDGNLITGQNPASSQLVAEKLLESLK